jgi:hypothetical protein
MWRIYSNPDPHGDIAIIDSNKLYLISEKLAHSKKK